MQKCWFTGWHWRKNSFWRTASLFKKTDYMLMKSDFTCLNSLGWQEDDSSTGMTADLFLGHNHKHSFHLLLWTWNGSLLFWPVLVGPHTKETGFLSGYLSADGHKFFKQSASNLWFTCHNVLYVPRMLQTSYICTSRNQLNAYFPHFHQSDFMMEDLNIPNPQPKFGAMKHEYHSKFVSYSWCHQKRLL